MNSSSPLTILPRSKVFVSLAAAVLLFGLTACGQEGSDSEIKTGPGKEEMVDWRQKMDDCMLKAGFDLTASEVDDNGDESTTAIDVSQYDMKELDKAYAKCTAEVGEPPVDENQPNEEEIFESQLIFASCMRDEGIDYPDPVKGNNMAEAISTDVDPKIVDKCSAKAYGEQDDK